MQRFGLQSRVLCWSNGVFIYYRDKHTLYVGKRFGRLNLSQSLRVAISEH
jgi:hypothetical protein